MIRFETTLGDFSVESFAKEAPISAANDFLDNSRDVPMDAVIMKSVRRIKK